MKNPFCLDTAMRRNCQNWNAYILSKLFFCHISFFSFTWKFWLILPVKMAIHERRKNFFKLQTLELYACILPPLTILKCWKREKSLLPYIHDLWWKSKHLKKWFSKVFKQIVYPWKTLYYFQRSLRIYLIPKVVQEDENGLTTPIEYCISLNVITQEWQGEFTLLTTASKICPQVASCGLPAVHLPEQHLCITGLCSVLRHLVAQLSPHQTLLGN